MSASFRNPDSMTPAQGEFQNRVKPSEPMTTKGHAPGVKVGNDAYPEFHAETYPPGTAPRENTYQPQAADGIPGQGLDQSSAYTAAASETLGGATSADVHQGFGHPGSGMTSQELHGQHKKDRSGLEGVGATGSDPQHKFQHDRPYETNKRGKMADPDEWRAEVRPNESA